jgi:hypothetical protein
VGVFLLCALAVYFLFLRTSEVVGIVTAHSWERTIQIEALVPVQEEGWDVPPGARVLDEREALYETRQVAVGERTYVCGQRDLGNGFFEDVECTEPVYEQEEIYRTRYRYEIQRWVPVRTSQAASNDGNAFWPQFSLSSNERTGPQSEVYRLHFDASDGNTYDIEVSYEEWTRLQDGEDVVLEVNAFGGASLSRAPP